MVNRLFVCLFIYLQIESTYYVPSSYEPVIDLDQHTDSNHDTALTLATAGGHDELVELLLARGANIEHRDKKGKLIYNIHGIDICNVYRLYSIDISSKCRACCNSSYIIGS